MQPGQSQQALYEIHPPARTTYVRFHNFQVMINTSRAVAFILFWGHRSNRNTCTNSIISRGAEILMVGELIVKASASIVVSQSVLYFGVLEWTILPPPPGRTNARDPNLERLTRLRLSCRRQSAVPWLLGSRLCTRQ